MPLANFSFILINCLSGLTDGLSVSFVLVTGLSRAIYSTNTIVFVGWIAAAVGAITMALGRYWVSKREVEHLQQSLPNQQQTAIAVKDKKVSSLYQHLDLPEDVQQQITEEVLKDKNEWLQAHTGKTDGRASAMEKVKTTAVTVGVSYALGSLLLLLPYLFFNVTTALNFAIMLSLVLLFSLGALKGKLTGDHPLAAALRITVSSAAAAGAAYWAARLFI